MSRYKVGAILLAVILLTTISALVIPDLLEEDADKTPDDKKPTFGPQNLTSEEVTQKLSVENANSFSYVRTINVSENETITTVNKLSHNVGEQAGYRKRETPLGRTEEIYTKFDVTYKREENTQTGTVLYTTETSPYEKLTPVNENTTPVPEYTGGRLNKSNQTMYNGQPVAVYSSPPREVRYEVPRGVAPIDVTFTKKSERVYLSQDGKTVMTKSTYTEPIDESRNISLSITVRAYGRNNTSVAAPEWFETARNNS